MTYSELARTSMTCFFHSLWSSRTWMRMVFQWLVQYFSQFINVRTWHVFIWFTSSLTSTAALVLANLSLPHQVIFWTSPVYSSFCVVFINHQIPLLAFVYKSHLIGGSFGFVRSMVRVQPSTPYGDNFQRSLQRNARLCVHAPTDRHLKVYQ